MFTQRKRRKERLTSTSSSGSNGGPYEQPPSVNEMVTGDGARPVSPEEHVHCMLVVVTILFLGAVFSFFFTLWLHGRLSPKATSNSRNYPSRLLPDLHHLELVDESDLVTRPPSVVQRIREKDAREFVVSTFNSGNDAEAVKSLSAAESLKDKKHVEKARKVFLHAIALSPKNPQVLNRYGEFVEEEDKDIVEADHLYTKALIYSIDESEEHTRALANRKRTAVLVEEIDDKILSVIDDKKKALQKISNSNLAFRRAKKEAYFQHVHHSVSIEGNTMSLAHTRSILETKLAVGGKSIMEHNEILGLDAALKYINQTLVDRVTGEIRLQDVVEIHKRVVGHSDPLEAGLFRRTQVFVGDHIPPPADHIEQLMDRFLTWLSSAEALTMHPVRLAALAHYKLVYIHPFVDGNGRTSRLLMNVVLMQHGFPPVIIRKEDRLLYYQHLVTGNAGDVRPFVRFIARCTERTLAAYLAASSENSLVPFTMHDVERITKSFTDFADTLEYHDKVVMGGMVSDLQSNTAEPHV